MDTYLGVRNTTALKNEVSTCRKIYDEKQKQVMVNQLVNDFPTWFLFKIDALPQDVELTLEIVATFFKKLIPDVREFLISEGVQVPQIIPTETNNQGNQRLSLVRNTAVEAEKNTRTIKSAVQPAGGSLHHRTFMGIHRGSLSIETHGLSSSFQYEEKNSMAAEILEEYELAYTEAVYENTGEQASMRFTESGG